MKAICFKDWLRAVETATSTASVAHVPTMLLGNPGNAFIHGNPQKQAKDCGLAMCPDDLNGNPIPRKKKK